MVDCGFWRSENFYRKVWRLRNFTYLCTVETATQRRFWKIMRSMSAFKGQEKIRVAAGFLLSCFLWYDSGQVLHDQGRGDRNL